MVARVENAVKFIQSPFFMAQVVEGMQAAHIRATSPWMTRHDAAEYCRCSVGEIDRAAAAGIIKRFSRGSTPLFTKANLDEAISAGKWTPAGS